MTTRVLLADDQSLLRRGLRMMIDAEADLEVVGEAGDGADAVRQARDFEPDVVMMDIRMPGMDGVEATRRICDAPRARRTRIIVLTTFDLDEYVVAALRCGASGFLLKDAAPDDILSAIRIVARGDALLAPSITRRLLDNFARRPEIVALAAPPGHELLTEREREVLALLARGLSNTEIAQALFLSETTVKTHVGRVLMKLGVRDRAQLIVLAYESGLVHPGEQP